MEVEKPSNYITYLCYFFISRVFFFPHWKSSNPLSVSSNISYISFFILSLSTYIYSAVHHNCVQRLQRSGWGIRNLKFNQCIMVIQYTKTMNMCSIYPFSIRIWFYIFTFILEEASATLDVLECLLTFWSNPNHFWISWKTDSSCNTCRCVARTATLSTASNPSACKIGRKRNQRKCRINEYLQSQFNSFNKGSDSSGEVPLLIQQERFRLHSHRNTGAGINKWYKLNWIQQ